ncbi:unnamed protein product [Adineta ricciae]|uniref:RING-type domain-containing protein n=1 Tax=Adineta ricciae TaxID=249248 RepID=A0A814JM26_ADIRI|nr:unnamed protein product [Adineta ricciae]CAF1646155.1 unnamed protein product [Adineta ricciae]
MDEKQTNPTLRRYHLLSTEHHEDEQQQQQQRMLSNHQQIIPISIDHHLATPTTLSNKRRRCSITTEPTLSSYLPSNTPDFIYHQNLPITIARGARKRSAQDDLDTDATHHFLRDHEHYAHKRARYEPSSNTELENQPPHATLKRRSLHFQHQQEQNFLSTTWDHLRASNEIPLLFSNILPASPRLSTTTTAASYHRTNSAPNHEQTLSDHYSSLLTEHHHHSSIFHSNSLITSNQKSTIPKSSKTNLRLLSPQSNGSSPLRATNFILDNKQQTTLRTGNISPAHSDSSSESTSTCSSDEQLHHHHYHIHQPQPWRSYRERENYEQLLDLAEKLSDPNRFNQVDVQQFFSYRYKICTLSSKQTACVICMSHFKNGQHIRVLPCQHEYHSKCIARWFTMNSSCPICRRNNFLSSSC